MRLSVRLTPQVESLKRRDARSLSSYCNSVTLAVSEGHSFELLTGELAAWEDYINVLNLRNDERLTIRYSALFNDCASSLAPSGFEPELHGV